MRVRIGFMIAFAVLLLWGTVQAATRIALVSGQSSAEVESALDTATALLSKDADVQLLDRAEVGRVLREQQLSLAGPVGAEHAIKAGQLLHADLFAVLEGSLTNETEVSPSFGLVVFDARTGVRYADSALTASNAVSAASATATAVRAAIVKSHRNSNELHTVGLLLVRNADLPREFDSLCDSVGLLLERELTASPGIAVLERRRLEQVNKERSLGADAEGERLLSFLQMIELDVGRDGEGLRGTVGVLRVNETNAARIRATVPTRNPATLAAALAENVREFLKTPPTALSADRAAEAQRFHREYLLLLQHRDYFAALRALDAAMALAPEDANWPQQMVLLLLDGAIEVVDPGGQNWQRPLRTQPASDDLAFGLALGRRSADLLLDLSRSAKTSAKPGDSMPEILKASYRDRLCRLLQKLAGVRTINPSTVAEIASLWGKERTLRMEVLEPSMRESALDLPSFAAYSSALRMWLWATEESYYPGFNPDQRRQDDALALSHWVEVSHKINPPDGTGDYSPMGLFSHVRLFRWEHYPELGQRLAQDSDPVIRILARASLIASTMREPGPYPTDKTLAAEREFRLYAQDLLAHDESARAGAYRNQVWHAIREALQLTMNHPQWGQECLEACHFAFAQGDVQPNLFRQASSALGAPLHRKPTEELEVLDGALKLVLEKPDAYPGIIPNPRVEGEKRAQQTARLVAQDRERLITDFQKRRDQLKRELGGLATNAPTRGPWQRTVCLFDLTKPVNGFAWIFKPVVQDGQVYAVALGFREWGVPEDSLVLVRVPLEGGSASFLGRAPISGIDWINRLYVLGREPRSRLTDGMSHLDVVRAACVGGGYYIAATTSGVSIFPTDGGPVIHLGTTNGLPSEDIHSVAFLEGKLYIGAGGIGRAGYLVSYDLASHEISVLASSRRSERLSPFDDQPPFCAFDLLADPARQRVLMVTSCTHIPSNQVVPITPLMGIWAYRPSMREFKQLASLRLPTMNLPQPGMAWAGLVGENILGVTERGSTLALLDIRSDQLLFHYDLVAAKTNAALAEWSTRQHGSSPINGPFFIRDGEFWSAKPFRLTMQGEVGGGFQRTALADSKVQELPLVQSDYPFKLSECFQLLEDGNRILAADQFSLWLLELGPQSAITPAESWGTNSAPSKQ